ncbi:MAG TPA: prepilin peptidase [Mycobacteriales bacterium]|nr:prepilin peptidase [Mycobacteriales bacterium]
MTAVLAAACGVLGLVIGSFLNVVIWRVPRGESIVRPGSKCPGCSTPIRPRDNIPVLSWLLLRGSCRSCGARISPRYPLVELGTAALFATLAVRLGANAALPAFLYLGAVGVALALIDIDVQRLPNSLTLPSYAVGIVLLGAAAAAGPHWWAYQRALIAMVALFAGFFLLALVYPGGMGFGDVKLSGVLGLYLGWIGWGALVVGSFAGFLLGGLYGVVLLLRRVAGRRSRIPFGPFLLLGALAGILAGQQIFHGYTSVFVH